MASVMSPSAINRTNFQWPVWGYLARSLAGALFKSGCRQPDFTLCCQARFMAIMRAVPLKVFVLM
eukprot:7990462-Ditylum_brightwellii.AAC.1